MQWSTFKAREEKKTVDGSSCLLSLRVGFVSPGIYRVAEMADAIFLCTGSLENGQRLDNGQRLRKPMARQVRGDLARHCMGWWLPMEVNWGLWGSLGPQSVSLWAPARGRQNSLSPGHWGQGQDRISAMGGPTAQGTLGFQHRD